ncbi:MotA/TolQ/ExbB proton channel family protein [Mangrovicoccus ximenensis]|uniref:MotA/TolQ/ExbB proton channel family protein n=1 Tax=Mangrovicoccus ximenensis TaxID=1911570 RepID=UPI0038B2FE79
MLARLERDFGRVGAGLRVLEIVAQVAPLLGLFGTVLGMIDAFRQLQSAGSGADPSLLAGGIWVALLTTAAGLAVAMPASVLLGWFDARLARHRRTADEALEELLAPGVLTHGAG